MSLTATNAQVYKGTAAVTYGSGAGVSGSQLQGTATITYGGAPTSNTALSFPGTSGNYMLLPASHPTNFDPSTSNVFVEAWVYWNGANWTATTGGGIYERENVGNTVQDFGMYTDNTGKLTSYMYTQNGSILRAAYNTSTLNVQQWYHVAFAYNTVNQTSYVWVNGNIGTPSTASNPARYTVTQTYIGFHPYNMPSVYAWNGYINDMRVIKGGIVPTTSFTPVTAPFRLGQPPYVTGGSTVFSLAEQYFFPSWVSLPGTQGSYMSLGVPKNAYLSSAFNTFIQCWVYINSTSANAGYIIMSTASVEVNYTEDWALRVLSGGTVQFYIYNSSVSSSGVTSSSALSAGRWYHIAVSYVYNTGTYGTMYMFVNGVFQNSSAMSGGFPRFSPTNIITVGSSLTTLGWSPLNSYIQDLQVVQGGTVPTTTFTPAAAPFGLASPSYVSGGTTVLSLATQYYQTGLTAKTLFSRISSAASASAKGIYSLYAVNGASPLVINVRNGTTAATSDFYGDIFGNLTTSAGQSISNWLGAATGFVTTWYDQSGLGNHAAQVTTALQPSITLGTPNLINFGGTGYFTIANQVMPIGNGVFTTVTKLGTHPTASQIFMWNFGTTSSAACVGFDLRTDYSPNRYEEFFYATGDVQGATYTPNATVSGVYNQSSHTLYLNGAQIGTSAVSSRNGASGNQTIGAIIWAPADGRGTTLYTGTMRDLYVFSTALSTADRNIMENGYTDTKVQFTSRAILPAVLVNPGTLTFTNGGTFTVAQTALEPLNGITWSLTPAGKGVSITRSTDYLLNLTASGPFVPTLFTVTATNRAQITTISQFSVASLLDLKTTRLLISTPDENPRAVIVNSYNGYIYYFKRFTNSIFIATTAGVAVTTVNPIYAIQVFGGGLAVNPVTGIVYFQYLNGSQWGFGAIAPGTYSVTYNDTTSFGGAPWAMTYWNGSIYSSTTTVAGTISTVSQTDTSSWVVSTYNTYTGPGGFGVGAVQGITGVGNDLYIMTSAPGSLYKNTSMTPLVATQDFWGLTSDGYYMYMGGAGNSGIYRTTIGTWGTPTNIVTGGAYNPPLLIPDIFYYNSAVYCAGSQNQAIFLLE